MLSTPVPQININQYDGVIDVGSSTSLDLRQFARQIHKTIVERRSAILPLSNIPIRVNILESLNIRYAEKQVNGIDENFVDYNNGERLQTVHPFASLPRGQNYLIEKTFSGDVSGDIGESVFVYLLTEIYEINGLRIGHLRPEKIRKHLTPDFVIFEQNTFLNNIVGGPYNLPLYAEVKSSTGIMDSKRIKNALEQLKTLMRSNSHGLVFLLYKHLGDTYNGLLIGVKS